MRQGGHNNAHQKPANTAELAKDIHWIHHATLWSQIGLGLIGLGALWIYHGQLTVMGGQLEQMKGSGGQTDKLICLYQQQVAQLTKQAGDTHDLAVAAGKQAEAANRAAITAAGQLQAFQDVSRLDQRAWIGIGPFLVDQFEEHKSFLSHIEYINSGRTPALQVEMATRYMIDKASDPPVGPPLVQVKQLKFAAAQSNPPQGNQTMHQEVSKEDIERHYNAIKSKTESLMIFGEIHYWDISHKQMHTTQFCVHLRDPDAKLMAFCDFFNDMN